MVIFAQLKSINNRYWYIGIPSLGMFARRPDDGLAATNKQLENILTQLLCVYICVKTSVASYTNKSKLPASQQEVKVINGCAKAKIFGISADEV